MKSKDIVYIHSVVENEGFDYAFRHYSSFEEVEDKEFHRLLCEYLDSSEELIEYLGLDV